MSTISEYLEELRDRPVTVIGMGISNVPLIKMLLRAGVKVTVRDKSPREKVSDLAQELESLGAKLVLGPGYLENLHEDIIFRTPGLSPNTPQLANALERGLSISSEMEVFFQTCPSHLVAVTAATERPLPPPYFGILKEAGKNVYVGATSASLCCPTWPTWSPRLRRFGAVLLPAHDHGAEPPHRRHHQPGPQPPGLPPHHGGVHPGQEEHLPAPVSQ